jgi:hypothetical protein
MVPGWVPFKVVSVSTVLYPRWSPLLKIEISSNGQNCSIRTHFWKGTTQESFQQSLVEIGSVVSEEKILKKFHPPFFLICIKHNDELFNIMNFELLPMLTDYAN